MKVSGSAAASRDKIFPTRFSIPNMGQIIAFQDVFPEVTSSKGGSRLKRWLRNEGKNSKLIMSIFVYLAERNLITTRYCVIRML